MEKTLKNNDNEGELAFFRQHLEKIARTFSIKHEVLKLFMSRWTRHEYPAKTTLFEAGNHFEEIWFIVDGALRGVRNVGGVDWTYILAVDGHFIGDYSSFLMGDGSKLSFQAVTDLVFYSIKKEDLEDLYRIEPLINDIGCGLATYACTMVSQRIFGLQTKDLKNRYEYLLKWNPTLVQKIPQQDIASFLGVTPQSLSRLKSRMARHKH